MAGILHKLGMVVVKKSAMPFSHGMPPFNNTGGRGLRIWTLHFRVAAVVPPIAVKTQKTTDVPAAIEDEMKIQQTLVISCFLSFLDIFFGVAKKA